MKKYLIHVCIAGAFLLPALRSNAQCNVFVKKKCMPNIEPFTSNGQMNTSTLSAGQSAQMNLTFSAGQTYRILVCAQEILGTVLFKVYDSSRKVVFDSEEHNSPDFWDFKARSTQQLTLEVTAPPSTSTNSIVPSGCVSVLIGFKKD